MRAAAKTRITRRGFLAGGATTPIAHAAAFAGGIDPEEAVLEFDLSDDRVSVEVRVIYKSRVSGGKSSAGPAPWPVEAASFGPNSWFEMHAEDGPLGRRLLNVRDASFGAATGLTLSFVFTPKPNRTSSSLSGAEPPPYPISWTLKLETPLWAAAGAAARWSSGEVHFAEFVGGKPLEGFAPGKAVGDRLSEMFDDRVDTDRKSSVLMTIQFVSSASWILARKGASAAEGFDSRLSASQFTFGWYLDQQEKPFFLGFALPDDVLFKKEFVLGDPNETHLVVTRSEPGAKLPKPWEVRQLATRESYSKLPFPKTSIQVRNGDQTIVDTIVAPALTLTEAVLPIAGTTLRHTVWEEALDDVPKNSVPDVYEIVTPAGTLSVAPPEARAQASEGGDQKTEASGSQKSGSDQSEASLAIGDRSGAPDSPIFAVFDKGAGAKDYSARRIAFDLALHAADFALTDASRTSLVFDKPPLAESVSTEKGSAPATASFAANATTISVGALTGVSPSAGMGIYDSTLGQQIGTVASYSAGTLSVSGSGTTHASSGSTDALTFGNLNQTNEYADLRLFYEDGAPLGGLPTGEYPRREASSFVWLGPVEDQREVGRFDLSRALLTASRDRDLAHLAFRFMDLTLTLRRGEGATIRPAREDCRVLQIGTGEFRDNRPVIVVEFPPQHVFEEAIFGQIPQLPDVAEDPPNDRATLLAILDKLDSKDERTAKRKEWRQKKKEDEKKANSTGFSDFCVAYEAAKGWSSLPEDQQIYIGPFALDPDAMAIARAALNTLVDTVLKTEVDNMFDRVADIIKADRVAKPEAKLLLPVGNDTSAKQVWKQVWIDNALRNESVLEQQEALYGVFRDYYREVMLNTALAKKKDVIKTCSVVSRLPIDMEYFADDERPPWPTDPKLLSDPTCKQDPRDDRSVQVRALFLTKLAGANPLRLDTLVEARLSGPSRLAFHLNCAPPPDANAIEAGMELRPQLSDKAPGSGGVRYDPIPFTLAGLTDWSRHEPAVVRRAQKLFQAAGDGLVPPIGFRAANLSDVDNLAFQGLTRGAVTAEQRLGEIRAALARKPQAYETAIEIPSRLTLSTAQDAIWFTKRKLPWAVVGEYQGQPAGEEPPPPPGKDPTPVSVKLHDKEGLWVARLGFDELDPHLRVVDSPDLRPNALIWLGDGGTAAPTLVPRQLGQGAPPRGALAPWFIAPEQMDGVTLTPVQAYGALAPNRQIPNLTMAGEPNDDNLCKTPWKDRLYLFLRQLCDRRAARLTAQDSLTFRSVLDAYDRHQLVLLSSAYGLPVIGKRQESVDENGNPTGHGPLVADPGQFDPGEDFAVIDADDDQAIQRPQPLRASELWLSALGGTLRHDTLFRPSAGANSLYSGKLFDGFSIESWREEIVLGRDIVGEVVYKGYLFPLGHRASLVKLTERLFVRSEAYGVKAVLVQRIFLRVSPKPVTYPTVGQPFGGRLWCAKSISIETTHTPDLQDPFPERPGGFCLPESCDPSNPSGGRISLGAPGLAFWPRVNESESGLVKFALTIDGASTETPLIFLDNIVATSAPSLRALCNAYRVADAWIKRRTIALGDQKVRYAQELKTGDCSFKTRSFVMTVSGLARSKPGGWVEGLDNYETNSALEGVEQPPFYPAVEYASIRLEQLERFSGRKAEPIDVQYDGRYARFGFNDAQPRKSPQAGRNPLDVYLNLRTCALLTMGANGDRGGGVGRPENYVAAIGRRNGPLSVQNNQQIFFSDGPSSVPGMPDPNGAVSFIVHEDGNVLIEPKDYFDTSHFPKLRSLADYFDTTLNPPAAVAVPVLATPAPALFRPAGAAAGAGPPGIVDQAKSLLEKFFSPEAKILGVVRFVELLKILGFGSIASLADATPVLKETLQFGAGLSEADANLAQVVHVQLLAPLLNTVQSFQAQWNGTPAKIGGLKTLPLQKAFPEIDAGLTDLASKLAKALNDNDTLGIALDLAEVYESAQAFAAALERIAANPAARLKQTAVDAINDVLGELAAPFSVFAGSITALVSLLKDAQGGAQAWVNQQLGKQAILDQAIDIFALSLPSPRLPDLAQQTGENVGGMQTIATDFEQALRKAVVDAAGAAVAQASSDLNPVKIRAAFIRSLATGEQDAASKAVAALTNAAAPIPAAAIVWRNELNALVASLAQVNPNADPPPVVSSVFNAADIAQWLFQDVKRLTSSGEPADLAPYAADLAGYLFGFDNSAFVDGRQSLMQILSEAVDKAGGGDLNELAVTFALPVKAAFADAVSVCDAYTQLSDQAKRGDYPHRTVPPGQPKPPSLDNGPTLAVEGALTALEAALAALKAASEAVEAWQAVLDASSGAERTRISAFAGADQALGAIDRSEMLLRGVGRSGGSGLGLIGGVATLYCDAVADTVLITAAATALAKSVSTPALTGALVNHTAAYGRAAAETAKKLGEDLFAVLQSVDSFGAVHIRDVLGFLATNQLIDSTMQTTFDTLSAALLGLEAPLVAALARVVNVALDLSNHAKAFGFKLATSAHPAVDKFDAALQRLGLAFDQLPKAKNAIQALQNLTAAPDFKPISVTPPPITFQALASTDIGGGGLKVGDLFNSSIRYSAPVIAARKAEIEVTAALGQIAARVKGLPKDSARQLVVIAAPLFRLLSDTYKNDQGDGLLKTRNLISKQVVESLRLQEVARRDLYVADGYSLPGFPAVDVTKPDVSFDALNAGDRLAEEAFVVSQANTFGTLAGADADLAFANFTRFAQSWSGNPKNRAAPLQIGDKVTELARKALKGEILSLIDISAFRTALLDAVANLVSTKATFAYDFASTVDDAPLAGSIFLPEKDAEFSLSTRIDVDLLHESHVDLTTRGSLGPFAIALVGEIVDALTLKFGGAKFESQGGGAPRFDISYQSYEIGPALDFAKQLQAYLTPSDGAGFHIGSSPLGVGIEAGYGVNLGAISIGPVSFFNIIFDVSADLPFDDRKALFKTSLGTRTTPFTISALPYAGSGYFSIYASADGIRGFEAGFMFGGGGALAFGPLTAQVQVQVGAFMRILKVGEYNLTEVAGTFLAAGSASIWIFHFGASLYVALEQSAGGDMRGEAIFTFSFSCGFVDYHYSITAHHNQAPVGQNNAQSAWLGREEPLTRYALATWPGRMSDAYDDLVQIAATAGLARKTPPKPPRTPDVTSRAICQSEDWRQFASYFDLALVGGR